MLNLKIIKIFFQIGYVIHWGDLILTHLDIIRSQINYAKIAKIIEKRNKNSLFFYI